MKINKYTTKTITEGMSIELDPEDFRGIEPAYTGDTDDDFIDYLEELEEVYYESELSEDIKDKLCNFYEFNNPQEVEDSSIDGKDFDIVVVEEDTWDESTFNWVIKKM